MSILPVILSILAALVSVFAAVVMLVLLLASGANSSPAQIRELKIFCWTLVIVTILALGAMVTMLVLKKPWWSFAAASAPGLYAVILLIVLLIRGDRTSTAAPDGFTTHSIRTRTKPTKTEVPMGNKADEHAARKEAEHLAFLKRVESMEEANELKAMEEAVRAHNDTLWSCCHIADLYRRRMNRLKEAGDIAGAEEAFAKSYDWMCNFASGATSGGEGAANSLARDEYLDRLIADLGYRPASVTPWNS